MTDVTVAAERPSNPVAVFRQQVESRQNEFAAALPAHIPAERFVRVILTAVNKNPSLLYADRASLFSSAMMAAADGLLCDGREAALVIYRTKKKDDQGNERWIDAVQYMPMVAGILKKVRNSGELSTIVAKVVYAGDHFRNWIDDQGEHLEYEAGDNQDRNVVRNAFAMAKLKDGAVEVEVLKPADIEKIRSVSRAKDKGPWVDWWEEMAKKSAIRRLSKRLPLNTDLDDLIRRDDSLYDFEGAREDAQASVPRSLAGKLDALAGTTSLSPPLGDFDAHTGEVTEANSNPAASAATGEKSGDATEAGQAGPTGPDKASPASNSSSTQPTAKSPAETAASGQAAPDSAAAPSKAQQQDKGAAKADDSITALPKNEQEYIAHARSWIDKLNDADAGEKKWATEKGLRNKSNTGADARETLQSALADKCREIRDADRS